MSVQPYREYQPPAQHERWMAVYEPMIDLAQRLANSPFAPDAARGNAGAVFSIILAGHGLGLDPVTSLQSISLIKGKPYIDTEVYLGRAYRAGHSIHWGECTDKRATVRVDRGDGLGSVEITYTLQQAQLAGYAGKDNWRRMPGEMLRARAVRTALKMVAPDLLLGIEPADPDAAERPSQPGQTTMMQLPQPVDNSVRVVDAGYEPVVHPGHADRPVAGNFGKETVKVIENSSETDEKNEPEPAMITRPQMRKIHAQIGELERLDGQKLDREQRREHIRTVIGLDHLESANGLTREQAGQVIEALDQEIGERLHAEPPSVEATPHETTDSTIADPRQDEVNDA